jgi:hypothetical protein
MLCVIDEFTRRCLVIVVTRRIRSDDVLQWLTDLFVARAVSYWLGQGWREDAVHRARRPVGE